MSTRTAIAGTVLLSLASSAAARRVVAARPAPGRVARRASRRRLRELDDGPGGRARAGTCRGGPRGSRAGGSAGRPWTARSRPSPRHASGVPGTAGAWKVSTSEERLRGLGVPDRRVRRRHVRSSGVRASAAASPAFAGVRPGRDPDRGRALAAQPHRGHQGGARASTSSGCVRTPAGRPRSPTSSPRRPRARWPSSRPSPPGRPTTPPGRQPVPGAPGDTRSQRRSASTGPTTGPPGPTTTARPPSRSSCAERTGAPLSYFTNVDVDKAGTLRGALGYVSMGHDEYWTRPWSRGHPGPGRRHQPRVPQRQHACTGGSGSRTGRRVPRGCWSATATARRSTRPVGRAGRRPRASATPRPPARAGSHR